MKIKILIVVLFLNNIIFSQIDSEKKDIVYPKRESLKKIIESHKGKVIYIDYWASWCKPCRKEILIMKELKDEFKDKNISFIYISVEGDKNECNDAIKKDGVIEENYLNYQLINDTGYKELDSIRVLPHYIIFNKEGELVNSDAPMPSQKNKLIKELDKYLAE
jgi:thiol-disulfide isomerase/thioredoxin